MSGWTSEQQFTAACSLDRRKTEPAFLTFRPEDLRGYLRSKPEAVEAVFQGAPQDTRDHTRSAYIDRRPGGGYDVGGFDGFAHQISYQHKREDAAADFVLAFWGLERLERPITEQILETFGFLVRDYGFIVQWRTEHFLSCYITFMRNDLRTIVEYEGLSHNCDVAFELYERGEREQYVSLAEILLQRGIKPYREQADMWEVGDKLGWIADQMRLYVLSVSSGDAFYAVFEQSHQ